MSLIFVTVYSTPAGDREDLQRLLQRHFLDRLGGELSSEEKTYTHEDVLVVLHGVSNFNTNMTRPYLVKIEVPYTKHLASRLASCREAIEGLLDEVLGDDTLVKLSLDIHVSSSSSLDRELLTR